MPKLIMKTVLVSIFLFPLFSCGFTVRAEGGGAFLVKDLIPGSHSGSPNEVFSLNNIVLFRAYTEAVGYAVLWKSDGSSEGTVVLSDKTSPMGWARFGNLGVFTDSRPFRSDGTEAGTFALSQGNGASLFVCVNDILFFQYSNRASGPPYSLYGYELWRSDGTPANTYMVKDINPGPADSYAGPFAGVNGVLFLAADDGVHGRELWKSDGTEAGTVLVRDINPGANGCFTGNPYSREEFQGQFFFAANDGVHGQELWKSDGTASGTVLVKDINPGSSDAFPDGTGVFKRAGGKLFFTASDGVHGVELWVTDGTEQGTHLVKDINPGTGDGYGYPLAALRDFLCITAYSPDYGRELWRTDGTENGTYLIKDIWPGPNSGWPSFTVCAQWRLYFQANDGGAYGRELWTSDGTPEGTFRVTDIVPGPGSSWPIYFAEANGLLLFQAEDDAHGRELWAIPLLPAPKAPASAQSAWWRRY